MNRAIQRGTVPCCMRDARRGASAPGTHCTVAMGPCSARTKLNHWHDRGAPRPGESRGRCRPVRPTPVRVRRPIRSSRVSALLCIAFVICLREAGRSSSSRQRQRASQPEIGRPASYTVTVSSLRAPGGSRSSGGPAASSSKLNATACLSE